MLLSGDLVSVNLQTEMDAARTRRRGAATLARDPLQMCRM